MYEPYIRMTPQYIAGRGKFGEFALFESLAKKFWRISKSAKRLLIVSTNLDAFSLANHERLAKFPNLSRYTVSFRCLPDV